MQYAIETKFTANLVITTETKVQHIKIFDISITRALYLRCTYACL